MQKTSRQTQNNALQYKLTKTKSFNTNYYMKETENGREFEGKKFFNFDGFYAGGDKISA